MVYSMSGFKEFFFGLSVSAIALGVILPALAWAENGEAGALKILPDTVPLLVAGVVFLFQLRRGAKRGKAG